jgi:hypothetical protein
VNGKRGSVEVSPRWPEPSAQISYSLIVCCGICIAL